MDATNGVPGRPLNWLPSGLTALILSLERTDSLALQLTAFSVSQAVKSLLSLKNKPHKDNSWGFHRSDSLTKPLYGMHLSGSPLASNACQCEDLCECCGCGEPYCSVCESEEYFEYEDHHVVPELQYQWGSPLAGLNGSKLCASDAYFRRESRSQRFASKKWFANTVQDFSWARPVERRAAAFRERECVSGKIDAQDSKGVGEKSPSMRSASVAPRSKDDDAGQVELGGGSIHNKKAEASPQRSSEATDSETQKSHATLKPSHNTTAHGDDGSLSSSQCAPIMRLSPNWWPFGVRSAAAAAVEPCSAVAIRETAKWNFRMGQNAGAGALAGGVVSLCLHPIDTLKTIVQSQSGGSRNLLPILTSVISERGLKGLYRGLGSNLASSAPISAIYTLTYEAVKAGLLRHIPEDMSALAHCGAGACASVATSIVYTPSECVKQQMQVNGLYQNSWQTLTSLLKQGGLPMLYKGWGAVLCRNVPQSVIKFYTYEALKHWARGDQPRDTPLTTLQALAIGGVAGSTAAFFTTPLDVVKTRLQTQIPGTVQQYNGVIHAFQYIATTEGVAGLYRGLVPRLVIYVTQGALFFASYEFIKHVLAVEVPRLQIKASQIEDYQRKAAPISAEST